MDLDNKVNDLMKEWIIFRDECLSRITEEYKPFKFSRLVMDGSVMDYLLEFEYHLKGYANLVEFELKEKFPAPSENQSFVEQVNYIYMIQEMVDEFVMEEVKLV